jgi:hypothetical protein
MQAVAFAKPRCRAVGGHLHTCGGWRARVTFETVQPAPVQHRPAGAVGSGGGRFRMRRRFSRPAVDCISTRLAAREHRMSQARNFIEKGAFLTMLPAPARSTDGKTTCR